MFQASPQNLLLAGASRVRHCKANVTLIVNNTTGSAVIFTVTGTVLVIGIWGEVTTVLSSNVTAAFLQLNDQTASPDITLATGVTLSSTGVGGVVYKNALTAAALKVSANSAGFFVEPASAGEDFLSSFMVGKKTAAVTTIDFTYSTTNAPSSGVIKFNALWLPLSADGNLA